ncbi:hypothetical protein H0H93_015389, partial [Arthromyces matolae]
EPYLKISDIAILLASVLESHGKTEDAFNIYLESLTQLQQAGTAKDALKLSLPEWATKTDVAAPLEALGAFYAEAGRVQFAIPHYLQAISVLVPQAPKTSTNEEQALKILRNCLVDN